MAEHKRLTLLRTQNVSRRPPEPAGAPLRHRGGMDAPVLPEHLFRGALTRERNRADRFDESSLLLLVSLISIPARRFRVASRAVIAAFRAVGRKQDVIGWFAEGRVLGMILPEADVVSAVGCDELSARFNRALADRLDTPYRAMLSVRVRVQAGSNATRPTNGLVLEEELGTPPRNVRAILRDAVKRTFDIAGSLAILTLAAPVLLLVAALVKLTSPGPIIFRQERVGRDGKPFTMLKFRTMYVDADKAIHQQYVTQFISRNAAAGSGSEAMFKIVNDPRVTPVGQFLRKTSLDEFPQFWNVLRGDMSLVGPRPPLRYEVEQYRRWHHRRVLEAKPGVTGLWQVVGRSRTTFDEMVRLDLRYVRTQSLWTDIKILLATPRAVISGKGAC